MRVTVLGCGNSLGVPVIGCTCKVCLSENPKNKRSRVSVLVEECGKSILIDSSPDLRQQALKNNIKQLDVVLYTHAHADHANGIDDIRAFNYLSKKSIPAISNAATINSITNRFSYIFAKNPHNPFGSSLEAQILPDEPIHNFVFSTIPICSFEQDHAKIKTLGYRIGNLAYSTDVKELTEAAFKALEGVEVWVVDCLQYRESVTHSHLSQTLEWIARVKPRLAILTHMSHEMDYDKLSSELPSGVVAGYDGMMIEL